MGRYEDYLARGRTKWGDKFDESDLNPDFRRWFESGERVKVEYSAPDGNYFTTTTGTIGATLGWRPAFILMRTSRSIGSSYVIGSNDRVVAVQRGRKYVEVVE